MKWEHVQSGWEEGINVRKAAEMDSGEHAGEKDKD